MQSRSESHSAKSKGKLSRILRKCAPALLVLALAALGSGLRLAGEPPLGKATSAPPPTRTDNVREVIQGVDIVDPYRWLEDQESPETRAWIDAQNKYTDSIVKPLPGREVLQKQLTGLLKVSSFSLPRERGGRYFFTMRQPDQDQAVLYFREGVNGANQVLVDPNEGSDHSKTTRGK